MKKGIMFSIIVFFLAVTLVGLIAIQRSLISFRREQTFFGTRIKAINNHYDSLIRDLGKTIEASTQRAIISCINNISIDNVPLSEANVTIKELIVNGTLDGEEISLMENATVPYWVQRIEDVSRLRGFDVDIDTGMINRTLVIKPYNSFYLLVEADVRINITDIQGVSALNRTTRIKKTVSIEGLEDPLYLIYFRGLSSNYVWESPFVGNYTQLLFTGSDGGNGYVYGIATKDTNNFAGKILVVNSTTPVIGLNQAIGVINESSFPDPGIPYLVKSDATDLISEGEKILLDGDNHKVWNIENLRKHIEGSPEGEHSYYQASDYGPSYLDRLEGRYTIDPKYSSQSDQTIGLESFVDKTIFPAGINPVKERSNIDYLYFSESLATINKIKGITTDTNWFRIDDEPGIGSIGHHEIYNVSDLVE